MVSTLSEFVVIAFLVKVEPLAAFVTAVVTIFNNALIFAVYSFFLPKDRRGVYAMPRSLSAVAGSAGLAPAIAVGWGSRSAVEAAWRRLLKEEDRKPGEK